MNHIPRHPNPRFLFMTLRPRAEELVPRDFKFARSELFGKHYEWGGKHHVLSLLKLRSGDRHDRPHTTLPSSTKRYDDVVTTLFTF